MMIEYISGFFDADGSVTVARFKKNETRQLSVSYTNTDLNILHKIKDYFHSLGVVGWITKAPKKEDHHLQSYQLVYYRAAGEAVMQKMLPHILHNKKIVRFDIFVNQYRPLIKRNGKYSKDERKKLEEVAQSILDIKI